MLFFQFTKPQGTVILSHISYCNTAHLLTGWHQHHSHGHSATAPAVHHKSGTSLQQVKLEPFICKLSSQQLCKMVRLDGKVFTAKIKPQSFPSSKGKHWKTGQTSSSKCQNFPYSPWDKVFSFVFIFVVCLLKGEGEEFLICLKILGLRLPQGSWLYVLNLLH